MDRKLTASLFIVIMITVGIGVLFVTLPQQQNAPEVTVTGGFITSISDNSATVRALALEMTVSLSWNSGTTFAPFLITAENMNPEKIDIQSSASISTISSNNASLAIEVKSSTPQIDVTFSTEDPQDGLKFYVFGDSQGYQSGIYAIAEDAITDQPDFVFHLGDLTPFGQPNQYEAVSDALSQFHVPVFTTAGNHDIRLNGSFYYLDYFGSSTYSFDYGPAHFVIFNSSSGDVTESELNWLESDLVQSDQDLKFVFTHIPVYDPHPGMNHTLLNSTTTSRLCSIFESTGVNTVFAGHIHLYNQSLRNTVNYVISGGAGATLYSDTEMGGLYHYVRVTIQDSIITIDPITLPEPDIERDMIVIRGNSEDITLTTDDLLQMNQLEGFSSFQNFFGNWRGHGIYRGITVSELLTFIGGMGSTDILRAISFDGFQQDYSYSNVHPNASWSVIQGEMVLAFSYNGTLVPEWDQGLRIIMLPSDGAYSNEDCQATSEPGMGYNIYASAGARWISNVERIEVISA